MAVSIILYSNLLHFAIYIDTHKDVSLKKKTLPRIVHPSNMYSN